MKTYQRGGALHLTKTSALCITETALLLEEKGVGSLIQSNMLLRGKGGASVHFYYQDYVWTRE
jgi:hypothetical protein